MAVTSVFEDALMDEISIIRAALERTAAERRRRQMVALIDRAVDECEALNLAVGDERGLPIPAWVKDLVERLSPADGEAPARLLRSVEAHGALLDLQAGHLSGSPIPRDEEAAWLAGDQVWLTGRREGHW
jgi:hypothetical protein